MNATTPPLAMLFPEGAYRFHLTLRRAEPREFFQVPEEAADVLRERERWIVSSPRRYARLDSGGEPLLVEFAGLAREWGMGPIASVEDIGRCFDADILFLAPDPAGQFRLQGGALCFPTGWALDDKLGHTMESIHGIVPGLNPSLGAAIHQFLSRLKPGTAFLRDNWGVTATDERNLHPWRALPAPSLPVSLDRLWLRVEHQALLALPATRGIVFGIRIALHRMDEVARDPARRGLRQALETMPADMAAYKRLDAIRSELIGLL